MLEAARFRIFLNLGKWGVYNNFAEKKDVHAIVYHFLLAHLSYGLVLLYMSW